jgi:hypothetical protein
MNGLSFCIFTFSKSFVVAQNNFKQCYWSFLHLIIQSALVKTKLRMHENSVHIAFDRAFHSLQNPIFVLFLYIIVVTSYIPSISSFVLMLCLITYVFLSWRFRYIRCFSRSLYMDHVCSPSYLLVISHESIIF